LFSFDKTLIGEPTSLLHTLSNFLDAFFAQAATSRLASIFHFFTLSLVPLLPAVHIDMLSAVNLDRMRVFGIDCGTEVTGFGVVESDNGERHPRLTCLTLGAIRLAKTRPLPERLDQVFRELSAELERWQPDTVAIEEVFYSVNAKSALKLGQVRGVALLTAARLGLPVAEYAPLKIKSSVVGYGLAKKEQVQFMVARLLNLAELPQPADAADALAIAICHIHTAQTLALQGVVR
jgi:crossover junction endodeoxyribonuclease RuvC